MWGFPFWCSCTISPASAVAASRRHVVPLPAHYVPLLSGRIILRHRSGKMLQLQERLDGSYRIWESGSTIQSGENNFWECFSKAESTPPKSFLVAVSLGSGFMLLSVVARRHILGSELGPQSETRVAWPQIFHEVTHPEPAPFAHDSLPWLPALLSPCLLALTGHGSEGHLRDPQAMQ